MSEHCCQPGESVPGVNQRPVVDQRRPEIMSPNHIVWHRLKVLRDANRQVAEKADKVMLAIEAADELDLCMQVAFGIQPNPNPMTANQSGPTTKPGFAVGK